jgi:hypothetical protein
MKANSLEELVTNSNIAGELRNYTDWHTRLIKFAQLVADWQEEQMMKEAVEIEVLDFSLEGNHPHINIPLSHTKYHIGDRVRVLILKDI